MPRSACREARVADAKAHTVIGSSVPRLEDAALLTGQGRYVDDIR